MQGVLIDDYNPLIAFGDQITVVDLDRVAAIAEEKVAAVVASGSRAKSRGSTPVQAGAAACARLV